MEDDFAQNQANIVDCDFILTARSIIKVEAVK